MSGTCDKYGERRSACRGMLEKPEGKGPLERPKCRRADNIKINLKIRLVGLEMM